MGLMKGYTQQETQQQYKRGEMYYISQRADGVGSEIRKDRPAVIVSCDACNKYSECITVVFLTTSARKDLPTHVTIRSAARVSEALCEEPTSISIKRIGNYVGKVTETEMQQIDTALMIGLGINYDDDLQKRLEEEMTKLQSGGAMPEQTTEPEAKNEDAGSSVDMIAMAKLETERDIYKGLYEDMLAKALR